MTSKLDLKGNRELPRVTYTEVNPAFVGGGPSKRLMVAIRSKRPCSYATREKQPKPCRFCAFWKGSPQVDGEPFEKIADLVRDSGARRIELLPGGSALDERQIPCEQLEGMLRLLATLPITTVFIPSRPEYVDAEQIRRAVEILGHIKLEIGVGIETFDEVLRASLGKGFTKYDFCDSISRMVAAGAVPVAFILTGLRMSAEDAHRDLMSSAQEIAILQKRFGLPIRMALEPYFETKETREPAGTYLTASFIAKAVSEIVEKFGITVFIATSGEGHSAHPLEQVRALIEQFNATQTVRHLKEILAMGVKA